VREYFVSVFCGIAIALVWLAVWMVTLRAFGILVFSRTPEERAFRRERLLRLGKLRYILIFGVFGYGFAFAAGIAVAGLIGHDSTGWAGAAAKVVLLSLLGGWFQGARTWNETFRSPAPFPPDYASLK
jgi:hypothetical protein